ncbi:MAG TPA: hypothetical protein ACFYEF_06380 [Candidatus Wunengus sp. YC63]|uniref:hypothetical protein n=1 Tax=Candidatus Wunengus sp. YC63 TaxID=3367699 RepID=UPI0027123CE9|nr:hypothetical protein [Candidatus Brocadiales bacterium]
MRRTHYLLLVVILLTFHVQSFAYGESTSSVQKDSRTTSSTEPTQKSAENHKENSISKSLVQFVSILLGISLMFLVTFMEG